MRRGLAFAIAALLLAPPSLAQAPRPLADLQAAARAGNAEAQFELGEAYRTGTGVAIDRDQAIIWLKRSSDQGSLPARDALGMLLFTRGNRQEAMPLIEAAAARGDPRALYILATARFNGDYVARDWPRAFAEMSRAAEMGLPQAKASLAQMENYLLPADRAKADEIRATMAAVAPPPAAPRSAAAAPPVAPPRPVMTQAAKPTPPLTPSEPAASTAPVAAPPAPASKPAPRPAPARGAFIAGDSPPLANAAPAPRPGAWRVQLGAYGSRERADAQWKQLAAKVPAIARYGKRITPVGALVRLQAEGMASRDAADALCRQVTAIGSACLTLAP